ncbi:MAG: HigA family addiction module antitoxin [Burkholderiaceae bacterium]
MTQMHNPPHPGEVLREWLGDMAITEAARKLGVTRVTLSRVLNGAAGISADMALRLEAALGTSPEMWMGLQSAFELWKASQNTRPTVQKFLVTAS